MKYVTPATQGRYMVPPGADHTTKFQEYLFTPGRAWKCVSPENGEWHVVEVDEATAKKLKTTWCLGTIERRAVVFFTGPDGVEYAQPTEDDPRAKDRDLGSGRKRSRFMSALKKARAEEAARQGKPVDGEPAEERAPRPKKERKGRSLPTLDDL